MLRTTPCTFIEGIWQSLSAVSSAQVQNCIRHGIKNLDTTVALEPPNLPQTTTDQVADDFGMQM